MESTQWNPGSLLQLSGYYWKTCTLHAGVKLEVFSFLKDKTLSAPKLASHMDADPRALEVLLNALAGLNLLTKSGAGFSNTAEAKKFLCKDSPQYIGFMIMHHQQLVDSFNKIPEAVKSGKPVRGRASLQDEETRKNFLMGMFNNAMAIAPKVAKILDLKDRKLLLDLGGGPGTYAIHFCKENPELKGVVFDLPTTEPFMRQTVERFALTGRIDFAPGSYLENDIPQGFDAAWLSHILHGEGPDACQDIVSKTAQAANPGAVVWIHEFILDDTMDGPLFPTLFSINMMLGTEEGRAYSQGQLMDMMRNAGMKDIKRLDFKGPTDSGIIQGLVP
ncbi:methyltransferase [Desulfatibacillum aliphaticivorans]|uniref:methyltransferase n=1 Tax=Desulfatibacillum aliphaticivorans TaxID=218208 RepID=UPI000408D7C1|nr:methyltransferase [Desulfatibacillum aliphaticivorans]